MIENIHTQYTHIIPHALLALFGGFVHALIDYRDGKIKSPLDFLALTVISSFTGIMVLFLGVSWFPEQTYIVGALAGTGGWLGVQGMAYVVTKLFKK